MTVVNTQAQQEAVTALAAALKEAGIDSKDPMATITFLEAHPEWKERMQAAFGSEEVSDPDMEHPTFRQIAGVIMTKGKVTAHTVGMSVMAVYDRTTAAGKQFIEKLEARFDNDYNKLTEFFRKYFEEKGFQADAMGVIKEFAYFTADTIRTTGDAWKWAMDGLGLVLLKTCQVIGSTGQYATHKVADGIDYIAKRPEEDTNNRFIKTVKEIKNRPAVKFDEGGEAECAK